MTRLALIVGVDFYDNYDRLFGCVADAGAVQRVLVRHGNGALNFECRSLEGIDVDRRVSRNELRSNIDWLFDSDAEVALFYFAGHGYVDATCDGYILTTDSQSGDREGVPLSEIINIANKSKAANKIIILDSCHSGVAGTEPARDQSAVLSEGMTILTASTADQYATEENGRGIFTTLLVDALDGSAANLTGDITPASVYAHVDRSLGGWEQRPVFKTNVKRFVSLRKVEPPIAVSDLRRITELFHESGFEYRLDPTYEPEMKGRDEGMPAPIRENTLIFSVLQQYSRLNLVVPVDAPHMWHAAMRAKACRLTALGEHYRRLVEKGRI